MQLAVKAIVSGVLIAVASEIARRSTLLGAIIISLPLTSIIALAWLYAETGDRSRVRELSWSILWIILPSLVFFIVFGMLARTEVGIPAAMGGAAVATALAYWGWIHLLARLGVSL